MLEQWDTKLVGVTNGQSNGDTKLVDMTKSHLRFHEIEPIPDTSQVAKTLVKPQALGKTYYCYSVKTT